MSKKRLMVAGAFLSAEFWAEVEARSSDENVDKIIHDLANLLMGYEGAGVSYADILNALKSVTLGVIELVLAEAMEMEEARK